METVLGKMREAGYVPKIKFVLNDLGNEKNYQILFHHSEKIVLSFVVFNMPLQTPIPILKNPRVCGEFHYAIKFISKIVAMEIIIMDSSQFYHFMDGLCSHEDYW